MSASPPKVRIDLLPLPPYVDNSSLKRDVTHADPDPKLRDGILLAKLSRGQEINLRCIATKVRPTILKYHCAEANRAADRRRLCSTC